jgi:hypothetical protein
MLRAFCEDLGKPFEGARSSDRARPSSCPSCGHTDSIIVLPSHASTSTVLAENMVQYARACVSELLT